jgi:hypothetical protein
VLLGVFEARHRAHGSHGGSANGSSVGSSVGSRSSSASLSNGGLGSALAAMWPKDSDSGDAIVHATAAPPGGHSSGPHLTPAASLEHGAAGSLVPPPTFSDLVRRSTRFVTSVPAAAVLCGLEDIVLNGDVAVPYPYDAASAIDVALAWEDYRLDVHWAGELVYSVHVFLLRPPSGGNTSPSGGGSDPGAAGASGPEQFMVEFRRGNMDIFVFKRYYEAVVDRLQQALYGDQAHTSAFSATGASRPGLSRPGAY